MWRNNYSAIQKKKFLGEKLFSAFRNFFFRPDAFSPPPGFFPPGVVEFSDFVVDDPGSLATILRLIDLEVGKKGG